MDTVTLDGVEYVKAAVAAKQFRYTADYIGQLCRGKKVDARLVGRTWFVNIQSIKDHKKARHQKSSEPVMTELGSTTNVVVPSKNIRKISVIAPIKAATRKRISEQGSRTATERRLRVRYELDDENLIPTLHRKETKPPRTIHIEHVDAKHLSIGGTRKTTSFEAEALPDVALSGKLAVLDYPEEDLDEGEEINEDTLTDTEYLVDEEQNSFISKVISDKRGIETDTTKNKKNIKSKHLVPEVMNEDVEEVVVSAVPGRITIKNMPVPLSFTPTMVKQPPRVERVSTIVLISPLIATILSVLCALALLLASNAITVSDSGYQMKIAFSLTNLLALLQQ